MDMRVRQALQLMSRDLCRSLRLNDVARTVNLSTPRLRYLCRAETGMTPAQHLKGMRMQEARRLLETTFLSVKQVSAGVGIGDVSHFVRDFKKAYGLTPTQYRERYSEGVRLTPAHLR